MGGRTLAPGSSRGCYRRGRAPVLRLFRSPITHEITSSATKLTELAITTASSEILASETSPSTVATITMMPVSHCRVLSCGGGDAFNVIVAHG